nr:lipopolysaccharide heptosyltransferase [uncultured bacterium]
MLNSFLIVRLGSLGDVVHAIPFAASLRAQFPAARIDWMVDPRYVELLEMVPAVDRRIGVNPRGLLRSAERKRLLRLRAELRRIQYDVVFDLQGLVKSAVLARTVGSRRVVGFVREHLREPLARMFYTTTVDPGDATHVIDMNLALLSAVDARDRHTRFPLVIPASPTVDSVINRFPNGYVLINPGAAWPNKRWPAACFGAVAAALKDVYDKPSLVVWGPGERSIAQEVVAASGGAADALPPTTIQELAGIARSAHLMISGDTGPLHVAAAVGTPIVSLFGPTRPERNGPWALYDIAISRQASCECHYERRCRRDLPCITGISVDEVLEAVARRLEAPHARAGA